MPVPNRSLKRKSPKLGGKNVELQFFSWIRDNSAFFIIWRKQLLLLQKHKNYSTKCINLRACDVVTSKIMRISRNQYVTFCFLMIVKYWHCFHCPKLYVVWVLGFFSVQVTWPAKYGCDSKILDIFPIEQMWPSSTSVEVRVSKLRWIETSHSIKMVVKSLPLKTCQYGHLITHSDITSSMSNVSLFCYCVDAERPFSRRAINTR